MTDAFRDPVRSMVDRDESPIDKGATYSPLHVIEKDYVGTANPNLVVFPSILFFRARPHTRPEGELLLLPLAFCCSRTDASPAGSEESEGK